MAILRPVIKWPGAKSCVSVSYTVSHGISPATATLVINPQDEPPAMGGTLEFGDGVRSVVLKDCVVERLAGRQDGGGKYHTLFILDRRWRWRTGEIAGAYNQLDDAGKLKPWTVRSPEELIRLCLAKQGEKRFQLRLPKGLTQKDGARLNRYLATGENFPQTLANKPAVWDNITPMAAAQSMAEEYGCRIAWDPATDTVGVGPLGAGDGLPAGGVSTNQHTIGVSTPPRPTQVGVRGGFVRYQARFPLEAVGAEWDGRIMPIDQLSYAPKGREGRLQVMDIRLRKGVGFGGITVNGTEYAGTTFEEVVANIPGNAPVTGEVLEETVDGADVQTLRIAGKEWGRRFHMTCEGGTIRFRQQAEQDGAPDWSLCGGTNMFNVTATDRLSIYDAQELARDNIFLKYRIRIDRPDWCRPGLGYNDSYKPWDDQTYQPYKVMVDTETGEESIEFPPPDGSLASNSRRRVRVPGGPQSLIPGSNTVVRRHQFILLSEKNDYLEPGGRELQGQAAPTARSGAFDTGIPPLYYDGYSRRRPAEAFGAFSRRCTGPVTFTGGPAGSSEDLADTKLYVPFSVDASQQMIVFAQPVYRTGLWGPSGSFTEAQLYLECAVYFETFDTGERCRPRYTLKIGGPAPVDWVTRENVVVDVTGVYGNPKEPLSLTDSTVFETDAEGRANYHLQASAARYQLKGAETKVYNGIIPVGITGKIQQVSYEAGTDGVFTTAGLNTEFAWNVPDYPERRLPENISADRQAAAVNAMEAARLMPPPGRSVQGQRNFR